MLDVQQSFKKIIIEIRATEYSSEVEYIKAIYDMRKSNEKRYSYRHFSEELGFGFTNYMHLIATGHRALSVKAAEKIAEVIGLKGRQKKFFLLLTQYKQEKDAGIREKIYAKIVETKKDDMVPGLQRDYLEFFSSWENSVILELVVQSKGYVNIDKIKEKLWPGISNSRIEKAVETLLSIGFLEKIDQSEQYRIVTKSVQTARNVRSLALVRYHYSMIELARDSLSAVHGSRRDISSLTLSAREEDFEKIKAEIETFRNHIMKTYDNSEGADQVYQFNLQLFPFTKKSGSRE